MAYFAAAFRCAAVNLLPLGLERPAALDFGFTVGRVATMPVFRVLDIDVLERWLCCTEKGRVLLAPWREFCCAAV